METAVKFILIGCLIKDVLCDFSINLPERIEALEGSCVFIPCTFDIHPYYQYDLTDATRIWKKYVYYNSDYVVFDSRSPSTGYLKGDIFGKPADKNCSTRFDDVRLDDSGEYYFRIEGRNNLKYNYYKKVDINVTASPSKPTVQLNADQKKVMEDSSVSLRCSANIYCPFNPPTLTWSSSSNTLILNDQQHQDQTKLISDLNFNITHLHHGVNLTCTIKYQLKDQNKTEQASRTLHVQYSPKNTSVTVNPSGSVLEGRSVTLTCISDGNPDVSYSWYRDTEEHLKHLQTGQNLTINKTDPTHSGRYYCRAQNQYGTQNSSVLLDIQYAPKNTSVTVNPSGSVLEGRSVTLTCISDGNPVNYSWYRDTEEHLQTGQHLTINTTDTTHNERYYCRAQNKYGEQNSSSVILNVTYAPKISTSSCKRSDVIVCVCEVRGNPSPTLEWRLSGRPIINSTEMLISEEQFKNKSLRSILTIHQSLKDTPTPHCFSINTHGTASQQFHLLLTPQDPRGFHHPSLLVGVAIGASVMMIFCIILFCIRRQKFKPSQTRQEDNTGLILTPRAVVQDDEGEFVYGNKVMMSHGGDVTQESLHYSSIDFTNTEPASGEIIGFSSLTAEYAVIQNNSAGASKAEKNISTPVMDPKEDQADKNAKITDVSSQTSEDPTYETINHR